MRLCKVMFQGAHLLALQKFQCSFDPHPLQLKILRWKNNVKDHSRKSPRRSIAQVDAAYLDSVKGGLLYSRLVIRTSREPMGLIRVLGRNRTRCLLHGVIFVCCADMEWEPSSVTSSRGNGRSIEKRWPFLATSPC